MTTSEKVKYENWKNYVNAVIKNYLYLLFIKINLNL